jgi:hypothetical protein
MTGGLAPQAEQQLAQTAARQRFAGNVNFGETARNKQLQTMLAAQYGEHSKRAFRYKELAHRKELATEAKRQFDQQLTQQRQMHESQMAADYNTGRRGKSVLGGMFGK